MGVLVTVIILALVRVAVLRAREEILYYERGETLTPDQQRFWGERTHK